MSMYATMAPAVTCVPVKRQLHVALVGVLHGVGQRVHHLRGRRIDHHGP